jgi:hypothetical protein
LGERLGLDELEKLIELCQKKRVSKLTYAGISMEIELPESAEQRARTTELNDMLKKLTEVSDEEILFNPYAGIEDSNDADN